MHVVVGHGGEEYEVVLNLRSDSATVGDLVAVVGGGSGTSAAIDGRVVDSSMPLCEMGLRAGSRIELLDEPDAVGPVPASGGCEGVFNRPPRVVDRYVSPDLELPRPPPEPAGPTRFGWGALVVPLILGAIMAVLVHPRMALFALFSPAMLLANWFEDRRRLRRERRRNGEEFRDALRRFHDVAGRLRRAELAHRNGRASRPEALLSRVASGDSRLWERRPEHDDFMVLPIGTGCIPWEPRLRGEPVPEATHMLRSLAELHDVPLEVRLQAGDFAGIAGDRAKVLAAARQVVLQAAVGHGPADLAISIFTETPGDWDWAKWLPHVLVDGAGRRSITATESDIGQVAALLPDGSPTTARAPHHLAVIDLPDLVAGDRSVIREALRDGAQRGIAGLALAAETVALPSLVTTIVSVGDGSSSLRVPEGEHHLLTPWWVSAAEARDVSRALARLDDPEIATMGVAVPGLVQLVSLLGLDGALDRTIMLCWQQAPQRPATPIGISETGPMSVDLLADGPHALLGGTTGAGKSELLRSLIAGLAVRCSPNGLNFVLIDYKGGSAFDACADFPHTVGVVTDLDEHLARRALICLDAELIYRERRLRTAGVSDIAEYPDDENDPLPRLLVVVDEFAALAKELPEFIEALVGIAQRGRSLGVHLLLATQRPSGVISDSIKANTNLRIGLRMQDTADSVDVIGCEAAVAIGRDQPGRAVARLGPGDVVSFQTGLVTARSLARGPVAPRIRPFVFAHEQPEISLLDAGADGPTDLEEIVAATVRVATELRLPPVRLPWPDVLPTSLSLDELATYPAPPSGAVFALADEPRRQRQVGASWSPASGNLLLFGMPGSGTTTALSSLIVGLSHETDPDSLHIYVLDFDDQALMPFARLPHVGAVVGAAEGERQLRLLRKLATELQHRRDAAASDPAALTAQPIIVTMLDNYGGFADAFDEPGEMPVRSLFTRLVADGPGVGIFTILTARHPGDVPTRLASLVGAKLAFRLADRYDYSGLGIPPANPPLTPGRAFESGSGREIQVAVPHQGDHQHGVDVILAADQRREPCVAPWKIDVLPQEVSVADVISAGRVEADEWFLPIGIGNATLAPAGLVLRRGDHALITGPARSGKSTALLTIAAVAKATRPDLSILALVPRNSPLVDATAIDRVITPEMLENVDQVPGEQLLLVDDAESAQAEEHLSNLVQSRSRNIRIVAAGTADVIRTLYGHWTQDVRRSRIGCALRPNVAVDGDLWQTPLPRRGPDRFPVGRGYLLADGHAELIQLGCG